MAEGAKNKISETLKKEFEIDDIDDVQIELEKMSKDIKKDKKSKEALETELESLHNWEE
jgi:septal ring factor EnvC (AmiA/AmiB activator)